MLSLKAFLLLLFFKYVIFVSHGFITSKLFRFLVGSRFDFLSKLVCQMMSQLGGDEVDFSATNVHTSAKPQVGHLQIMYVSICIKSLALGSETIEMSITFTIQSFFLPDPYCYQSMLDLWCLDFDGQIRFSANC